ncbi:hypothetical protein WDU94_009447 [Cyamophila willieti]
MMDVAIKDKWLNLEAKCRLCKELLCCKEHRIAHEDKKHPFELRSFLSSLNNNLNTTVSGVKVGKSSRNESKASKEKVFKTPPTPASTRKRKRETVSIPENLANQHLLQSLSKKKKNRSNILPYLRTPKENPKSPLAIINNGVKNEILVENNACGSATKSSICLMKTSSPFSVGKENDFISMTPIENRSPEIMSIGSGENQNNNVSITPEMSYGLQLKKESHDNAHNEISDMDISRNSICSIETNGSKIDLTKEESIGNNVEFDENVRNGTQMNDETKLNHSSGIVFQKNESFTSSGMSSPSVQDISLPHQLNSSDNFSNGSNQSGNLSGFQMILSPPDTFKSEPLKNENNCQINCVPEQVKIDSNETMDEQNKQDDETMDEIFMTPVFNNESNDMSVDEFRTPSEWENSTSVLKKCDNKTPKCPAVYRTPKVLEHRINNLQEKISANPSLVIPEESNQVDEKTNQVNESRFEKRKNDNTLFIKGSFEFLSPDNLATLLQNPGNTFSKRDSGFQTLLDTSNISSGNYSNRLASNNSNGLEEEIMPLEYSEPSGMSFNNDSPSPMNSRNNSDDLSCNISLRDCNLGEEFTFQLDPGIILDRGLNLSNSSTDSNDYIGLNEKLKNHPNINYERRKNLELFTFDVEKKFENECDLSDQFSPPKLIEEENDISMEISEQSMVDEEIQSTVVVYQSMPDENMHNRVFVDQPISNETVDQSIPDETKHNTEIVDKSLPDETIQNTVVGDQSISEKTINSAVVVDKTVLDETVQNTIVFDKSVLDDTKRNVVVDKSNLDETIHYPVAVDKSVLHENIHRAVVFDLNKTDYEEIEEHIRRRAPIREYTTTLEISRKLLHRVQGRGPYYSQVSSSSIAPCIMIVKKELKENEKSPVKENDQAESSTCNVM